MPFDVKLTHNTITGNTDFSVLPVIGPPMLTDGFGGGQLNECLNSRGETLVLFLNNLLDD
jgi:hypothetical protein